MRRPCTLAPASKSSLLGTLATSPASGPEIACSTSIASSTLRVSGPSLSSDEHGSCVVQAFNDHGIFGGHAIPEGLSAICGRDPGGVKQVLGPPGDAVQRPAVLSCGDFFVGPLGLREGQFAREGDDAA